MALLEPKKKISTKDRPGLPATGEAQANNSGYERMRGGSGIHQEFIRECWGLSLTLLRKCGMILVDSVGREGEPCAHMQSIAGS